MVLLASLGLGIAIGTLGAMCVITNSLRDRIKYLERRCDDNGIYS